VRSASDCRACELLHLPDRPAGVPTDATSPQSPGRHEKTSRGCEGSACVPVSGNRGCTINADSRTRDGFSVPLCRR
jgi:hypothetical protein